jgi:nucleotide-binding universal stress UspA family protein
MTIVVATDLSFRSGPAIARALQLARDHKEKLVVLHVIDAGVPESLRDEARSFAEAEIGREIEALSPGAAVRCDVRTVTGKPREEVARVAQETGASLIVLGRHDASRDGLFGFTDSTAGHVARKSPVPALIVVNRPEGPYRRVLVGVDFSVYGKSAIRHALRWNPDAGIVLAHAYQIPFKLRLGTPDYVAGMTDIADREMKTFVDAEMTELVARVGDAAIRDRIVTRLVEGMPGEVLRAEQASLTADLLVIGTHGSAGLGRVLWGSVARELVDDPPCDVLIVHGL